LLAAVKKDPSSYSKEKTFSLAPRKQAIEKRFSAQIPRKQKLFKNVKRIKSEFKILICSFALNLFPSACSSPPHPHVAQVADEKFSFFSAR